MSFNILFTVGTTQFNKLILKINEINFDEIFEKSNLNGSFKNFNLVVQYGKGEAVPDIHGAGKNPKTTITTFKYRVVLD